MKKLFLILFCLFAFAFDAEAANRYASPSGTGSAPCATNTDGGACPLATALPLMRAGDVLSLRNGTYNLSNGMTYDCNAGMFPGTADNNRVTIKALNDRQAWLNFTGGSSVATLKVANCSYVSIEGLRISGNSAQDANITGIFWILNSSNIVVRRNLLHNCEVDTAHILQCLGIDHSTGTIVEENEFYYFYRYAIQNYFSTGTRARRNYCNPRTVGGPVICFTSYPGSDNTAENNISENAMMLTSNSKPWGAGGFNQDNKAFGNIVLNGGGIKEYCTNGSTARPLNFTVKNNVIIGAGGPSDSAIALAGSQAAIVENNTILSGGGNGISMTYEDDNNPPDATVCPSYNDGLWSMTGRNNLVYGQKITGFNMAGGTWSLQASDANSNTTNYNPGAGDSRYNGYAHTDAPSAAQLLCPAFIIPVSPGLKGTGVSGADIGANAGRYFINGVEQSGAANLVFDPTTRAVRFAGATVAGINDSGTQALINFHTRFHPNCALANFPTGAPTVVLTITTNGGNGAGVDFTWTSATRDLGGTLQ